MSALHLALLSIFLVSNCRSLRVTEWSVLTQVSVMEQFLPPLGRCQLPLEPFHCPQGKGRSFTPTAD